MFVAHIKGLPGHRKLQERPPTASVEAQPLWTSPGMPQVPGHYGHDGIPLTKWQAGGGAKAHSYPPGTHAQGRYCTHMQNHHLDWQVFRSLEAIALGSLE